MPRLFSANSYHLYVLDTKRIGTFKTTGFEPIKSLNYGETLLVRNLENDFENVENWLAITMDKGTFEIPDWRSEIDSGQFKIIIT